MVTLSPANADFLGKIQVTDVPVPEDDFSVLPRMTHEEAGNPRSMYVHRHQDKVTFVIRYKYTNENHYSKGKYYSLWRNLNVLTLSLNKGRLNVFFSGKSWGHSFPSVANITRNPYIITRTYTSRDNSLQNLIEAEFIALLDRNHISVPLSDITAGDQIGQLLAFEQTLLKVAYPSWVATVQKSNAHKLNLPPLFATDVFREPSLEAVADTLFDKTGAQAKRMFLTSPEIFLAPSTILKVMLSKKRTNQDELLNPILITDGNPPVLLDPFKLRGRMRTVNITFKELMLIRSLLKLLPSTATHNLLTECNETTMDKVKAIAEDYGQVKNQKEYFTPEKVTSLARLAMADSNPWLNVLESIKAARNAFYTIDEVNNVTYEWLSKLGVLMSDTKHWQAPKIWVSTRRTENPLYNVIAEGDMQRTAPFLRYPSFLEEDCYRVPLYTGDKDSKHYYAVKMRKLKLNANYDPKTQCYMFNCDTLNLFVKELLTDAETVIRKAGLPVTDDMLNQHLKLVIASTRRKIFTGDAPYGVPLKLYKLIKQGHSVENALLLLRYRMSLKDAESYVGVPTEWVKATLCPTGTDEMWDSIEGPFDF